MNTRDQAIACITEKLRELAGIENALHANHMRATKELGGMSYQTYSDHREAAELHYFTADYYELLIEAIAATPLFDQLDKEFPREESTDAFVDAADAERYAQRDEYVNGDRPVCICSTNPDACRAFGRGEELDAVGHGRELDDVYAEGEREAEEARLAEENEAEWQAASGTETFNGLGSAWADPAVRRAVRDTIAEQTASDAESEA